MTQHEFEGAVLRLWTTTRVPLTRAHLQAYTEVPRAQIERWLDAMVSSGMLDMDSDDEGELLWKVRGAARARAGPGTIDEVFTLERLRREVALLPAEPPPPRVTTRPGRALGGERKSLVASGLLSFFLGPVGWLYAAPLKEAVPAILALFLLGNLLPSAVMATVMSVVWPLSSLAGLVYAWRYNQTGRRTALLGSGRALPSGRD